MQKNSYIASIVALLTWRERRANSAEDAWNFMRALDGVVEEDKSSKYDAVLHPGRFATLTDVDDPMSNLFPAGTDPALQVAVDAANAWLNTGTPSHYNMGLFHYSIAALCAWREARDSEVDEQAVLHVIANRSKKWGQSVLQVVTARNQFSSMTFPRDPQTVKYPGENDARLEVILPLCNPTKGLFNGQLQDPTRGSLYYWNPKASSPTGWFAREIAGSAKHPEMAVVGAHHFYL